MPLYEYHCPQCNQTFEAYRPLAHRETALCLQCGRIVHKVLSTFNFSFGWILSDRSLNERFAPKNELVRNV